MSLLCALLSYHWAATGCCVWSLLCPFKLQSYHRNYRHQSHSNGWQDASSRPSFGAMHQALQAEENTFLARHPRTRSSIRNYTRSVTSPSTVETRFASSGRLAPMEDYANSRPRANSIREEMDEEGEKMGEGLGEGEEENTQRSLFSSQSNDSPSMFTTRRFSGVDRSADANAHAHVHTLMHVPGPAPVPKPPTNTDYSRFLPKSIQTQIAPSRISSTAGRRSSLGYAGPMAMQALGFGGGGVGGGAGAGVGEAADRQRSSRASMLPQNMGLFDVYVPSDYAGAGTLDHGRSGAGGAACADGRQAARYAPLGGPTAASMFSRSMTISDPVQYCQQGAGQADESLTEVIVLDADATEEPVIPVPVPVPATGGGAGDALKPAFEPSALPAPPLETQLSRVSQSTASSAKKSKRSSSPSSTRTGPALSRLGMCDRDDKPDCKRSNGSDTSSPHTNAESMPTEMMQQALEVRSSLEISQPAAKLRTALRQADRFKMVQNLRERARLNTVSSPAERPARSQATAASTAGSSPTSASVAASSSSRAQGYAPAAAVGAASSSAMMHPTSPVAEIGALADSYANGVEAGFSTRQDGHEAGSGTVSPLSNVSRPLSTLFAGGISCSTAVVNTTADKPRSPPSVLPWPALSTSPPHAKGIGRISTKVESVTAPTSPGKPVMTTQGSYVALLGLDDQVIRANDTLELRSSSAFTSAGLAAVLNRSGSYVENKEGRISTAAPCETTPARPTSGANASLLAPVAPLVSQQSLPAPLPPASNGVNRTTRGFATRTSGAKRSAGTRGVAQVSSGLGWTSEESPAISAAISGYGPTSGGLLLSAQNDAALTRPRGSISGHIIISAPVQSPDDEEQVCVISDETELTFNCASGVHLDAGVGSSAPVTGVNDGLQADLQVPSHQSLKLRDSLLRASGGDVIVDIWTDTDNTDEAAAPQSRATEQLQPHLTEWTAMGQEGTEGQQSERLSVGTFNAPGSERESILYSNADSADLERFSTGSVPPLISLTRPSLVPGDSSI
jgi:hypothetical protein